MSAIEPSSLDAESGISKEDQQEILNEIEKVATENRIVTKAEDFVVRAAKRGVLLPLVVAGAAVAALLAGGALLYVLFQRGETRIIKTPLGTITVEGQLIAAVRKDADAKIQEKNLEINTIQSRLQDIDKQRQDLQSNMDAKVAQKAAALKADMDAAVQAERERLVKAGMAQKVIDQRIQELQAQRNVQLQKDLGVYRKQADAERLQAEQNLKTLQQNFTDSLAKANAERTQVIADATSRETALRAQYATQSQALQQANAQAQQALNALTLQRQQEDLVTSQLLGLYAVAQQAISQQSYDKALLGLAALKTYVERPDVAALPTIARRHDFDEFVIDSLTKYVQAQMAAAQTDTASLLEAANELTTVRQHVAQASALVQQGKTQDARAEFDAAIQTIPEVATSYAYFVGSDRAAEAARQASLTSSLGDAEAQISAGNYAAAAASYRAAFSYLPIPSDRIDKAVANLQAAGAVLGSQRTIQDQTRAAAPLLAKADSLSRDGNFDEATAGYLDLLGRYPLATQGGQAMKGIQAAVKGLNDAAAAASAGQQQALKGQITSIQQSLQSQIASIQQSLGGQISSLQQELAARRLDVTNLQGQLSGVQGQNTKLMAQIDLLSTQLKQQTDLAAKGQISEQQRAALQARMDAMQKAYTDYTSQEDPILKAKGDLGLMDTEPYFNGFFSSSAIQAAFPGISDRVKRYDQGFQSAGRSDGLQDAINVVVNFAQKSTPALKRAFIQDQLKAYAKDPDMVALLDQMDQRLTR